MSVFHAPKIPRRKHNNPMSLEERQSYAAWVNILHRCLNPEHHDYPNYGGKGITVAKRWTGPSGFVRFLDDVGVKPAGAPREWQIHRTNNTGNYEPGNVSWQRRVFVQRRIRSAHRIEWQGVVRPLKDVLTELGLVRSTQTIYMRLRNGWSVETALKTPIDAQRSLAGRRGGLNSQGKSRAA